MRLVSRSGSFEICRFLFALLPVVLCTMRGTGACAADSSRSLPPQADTAVVIALEDVLERSLGIEPDSDLVERLLWMHEHPIDLNEATENDLLSVPGVSPVDVEAIQRHRRKHGPFTSPFDLAGIEGVSARTWTLFRPFVSVAPRPLPLMISRSRTIIPLHGKLEADTTFPGSNVGVYQRLIFRPRQGWECGGLCVADVGERIEDGVLSGYMQHESQGFLRRLIVGDFSVTGGLGLVWGQGLRKDRSTGGLMSGSLSPNRSSGEQGHLRGIGMSLGMPVGNGEGRVHLLASRTPCAATLDTLGEITSLSPGGAYLTANTLERKDAATYSCLGGRCEFAAHGSMSLGMTMMKSWFDHAIRGNDPFELSGADFFTLGIDGTANIGPARCALEYAYTPEGFGIAASAVLNAGRLCAMHLLVRHCDPAFRGLLALGGGFGDGGRNTNEVRWSLEIAPFAGCYLQAEVSQFRKPWRSALEPFPTGGRELAMEAGVRLARGFELSFRGEERSIEHKADVIVGGRTIAPVAHETRRRIQCTGNVSRGEKWHLRGRIEVLRFLNPMTGSDEAGWMTLGEVRWEPARWVTVAGRVVMFQTDSYDSRLATIESNVDGLTGSTVLFGTGRRWYCLVACRPFSSCRVSARYVSTERLVGARSAGRESQITVQVDFQGDPP